VFETVHDKGEKIISFASEWQKKTLLKNANFP
jgi:hypothetical protein